MPHSRRLVQRTAQHCLPLAPGAVDGWFALHGRFGKLPMKDLLAPTIRYAREGHPVHQTIAYYWERSVPRLSKFPGFKEQFTVGGRAPRTGEMWKNPYLADTLQKIAGGGRDAFYKGDIARTIDAYFKANGGFLSYEDMAAHQGEWVEPVSTNYRGYDVWELPPNGQGIAALQMLNVLEGYDFSKIPYGSPEHVHLLVEAKKLAFADRARWYADPAFQPLPVARMISKPYARERARLISPDKVLREVQPGTPKELEEGDTIYMTVADNGFIGRGLYDAFVDLGAQLGHPLVQEGRIVRLGVDFCEFLREPVFGDPLRRDRIQRPQFRARAGAPCICGLISVDEPS